LTDEPPSKLTLGDVLVHLIAITYCATLRWQTAKHEQANFGYVDPNSFQRSAEYALPRLEPGGFPDLITGSSIAKGLAAWVRPSDWEWVYHACRQKDIPSGGSR
jgi:hypothetical protein